MLLNAVESFGVCTVKEAVGMADDLVRYADYSGPAPVIDQKSIQSLLENRNRNMKRSEVR